MAMPSRHNTLTRPDGRESLETIRAISVALTDDGDAGPSSSLRLRLSKYCHLWQAQVNWKVKQSDRGTRSAADV